MFVSNFMHFHCMSSRADFQTLRTLKTRRWYVLCFYMCLNCGFCWVCIVTGAASPESTVIFRHQRFNSRLNFSHVPRYIHCDMNKIYFMAQVTTMPKFDCGDGNDICECSENSWLDNVSGKLDTQSPPFASALLPHAHWQPRYDLR